MNAITGATNFDYHTKCIES